MKELIMKIISSEYFPGRHLEKNRDSGRMDKQSFNQLHQKCKAHQEPSMILKSEQYIRFSSKLKKKCIKLAGYLIVY
ncbi:hypothetical protein KFK09_007415 [Dendrobium nobile]|uniref:Uncharacterized protein n=1 Tax=Dendrobium nobile TaxID=94219 RepID=A0A8T3BRT3_DENNO|nr:hypothetical protein KFK09_007415 [Dendrobium nobile]